MSDGSSGGGGGAADSYIGSLISLTSKSEIRYEGVLYTVDTANSNIALQDVRSFGTEGRKKDGPQIPPSDKVYDYIIFRGSDIKDLQVKMSPPVRSVQPQHVHHDPAIISLQSQTSPMVPPSTASSSASTITTSTANASGTSTDTGSLTNISSVYQGNASPLYQPPQGGLSSWAMPPMPQANMYWAGYYRPPTGISHFQQQPHMQFQPPAAMPYTPQTQYLPLQQQPLAVPPSASTSSEMQAEPELPSVRDAVITALPESATELAQAPEVQNPSLMEEKIGSSAVAISQSVVPSTGEKNGISVTTSSPICLPTSPPADLSKKQSVNQMTSEPSLPESSTPTELITPSASTSQQQNVINEPLLPLPVNSARQKQTPQVHGSSAYPRRGRGRGRGAMVQNQFTEDFDFTAMNEKFNKDEVWGELGKADSRDKGDGEEDAAEAYQHEEEDSYRTPVYVKEDFFDTLSSDAYDSGGQDGRMKFSEQRRINAETFGRVSVRSHRGRGGRNGYRGGHRGGGHYGSRGAGNGGRGRNYSRSTATY